MKRSGARWAAAALAGLALAARAGPLDAAEARFPQGAWSVGAQGGVAFLAMADINDLLRARDLTTDSRFEELRRGWDVSADVRYGVNDRFFLGVEAGALRGRARDRASATEVRVRGTPVLLVGGATIDASGDVAVRAVAGVGALAGARFEEPGVGRVRGTAFLGYAGAEVEVRMIGSFALTAQGLARTAFLAHPDDAPYNVDFSGGSLRAGARGTFGGGP